MPAPPEGWVGFQIVGANVFRAASAEAADTIRRLVDVLQVGLQVVRRRDSTAHLA